MNLDLNFVRAQFPAFREPTLAGFCAFRERGRILRRGPDDPAGSTATTARPRSSPTTSFAASATAGEQMDAAKARMAAWLNVGQDEVHFGPSTSQNTFVSSRRRCDAT